MQVISPNKLNQIPNNVIWFFSSSMFVLWIFFLFKLYSWMNFQSVYLNIWYYCDYRCNMCKWLQNVIIETDMVLLFINYNGNVSPVIVESPSIACINIGAFSWMVLFQFWNFNWLDHKVRLGTFKSKWATLMIPFFVVYKRKLRDWSVQKMVIVLFENTECDHSIKV